jgi:hypothetical protein
MKTFVLALCIFVPFVLAEAQNFAGSALSVASTGDYIQVPSASGLQPNTGNFTAECWIKRKDMSSAFRGIMGKGAGLDILCWQMVIHSDGQWQLNYANRVYPVSSKILDTLWHHLAATVERTGNSVTVRTYLDGAFDAQASGAVDNSVTSADPLYLGSDRQHLSPFGGLIDEVRIWSVMRSQAEIQGAMHSLLTGIEPGLVGCWRFDNSAKDLTPNSNDGTVIGQPLFTASTAPITSGTGSLTVSVNNAEGWGGVSSNGIVDLYDGDNVFVASKRTASNSIATFATVTAGNSYSYRVRYSPTPAKPFGEETWGTVGGISIVAGQATNGTFVRNLPYIPDLRVYEATSNVEILGQSLVGKQIRVDVTVRNPNRPGSIAGSFRSRLLLDRDMLAPFDFRDSSSYQILGLGNDRTDSYTFTPSVAGTYRYLSGVAVDQSGTPITCDGSEWSTIVIVGDRSEYIPDVNTVGLYHLDELNGRWVFDASGQGNHGPATGTSIVNGRFNQGRSFAGSPDFVSIPDNNSFNFSTTNAFSVECWAFIPGPFGPEGTLVARWGPGGSEDDEWGLTVRSSGVGFLVAGSTEVTTSLGQLPTNVWVHLAGVWDGNAGTQRLFINGVLAQSASFTPRSIPHTSTPLRIGYNGAGGAFTGLLDEVRISNKARQPQEFNLQLPPKGLQATPGSARIDLSWQNGGGAVGLLRYRIYRGSDSSNVSIIDSTRATTYADVSATPGTRFCYRVGAVDSSSFEGVRSFAASGTANSMPGLVAYYPFDGNANDMGGNGFSGTINGGVSSAVDRFGSPNGALFFDGSSGYVNVPTSNHPTGNVSITYSAWVKPIMDPYAGWRNIVRAGSVGENQTSQLELIAPDGYKAGYTIDGKFVAFPYVPPENKWTHIVLRKDADTVTLYANGAVVSSYFPLSGQAVIGNRMQFGGTTQYLEGPYSQAFFHGAIDDIRIYSRPLNPREIDSLYHDGGWATPVSVGAITPLPNALSVPKSSGVSALFNIPVSPTTLNASNIDVRGLHRGKYHGTITLNGDRSFTFDPDSLFKSGESITVTLSQGIKSTGGDSIKGGFHWGFVVTAEGGNGIFAESSKPAVGNGPQSPVFADLDGDGDLDIAVANTGDHTVSILKNNGKGYFVPSSTCGVGDDPLSIAAGDFDMDGDIDLAVANIHSQSVSILTNDGSGVFSQTSILGVGISPMWTTVADYDGDGDLDLAVAVENADNVTLFKNNGLGVFSQSSTVGTGRGPRALANGDFDGDGDIDMAVVELGINSVSILKNSGNGTFSRTNTLGVGSNPISIACGDLDGDGDLDLAVVNYYSNSVSILKNNAGMFALSATTNVHAGPHSIAAGDWNGDGRLDLAVGSYESNRVSLLWNDGSAVFSSSTITTTGSNSWSIASADVENDGCLDLAVANYTSNNISVFRKNYGGLVAYYPFNGNAIDQSGNGFNGVPTGVAPCADRFGQSNSAYDVNGEPSFIQISGLPTLDRTFTYSAWIKARGSGNFGCVGTVGSGNGTCDIGYDVVNNWFSLYDRTNGSMFVTAVLGSAWHHVVHVYNSTTRAVYLDGTLLQSQNISAPIPTNVTDVLRIGRHTLDIQQFNGQVDDIRIYSRALSTTEIDSLYHIGGYPPAGLPPWRFSNTGVSHSIVIPTGTNPNINGVPLVAGDYVGVFYDSSGTLACVGYERWTGTANIALTAFGDDPTSPAKDGLATGEIFRWKIFRGGDNSVHEAEATYAPIGGIVTNTNTYATNGISQLVSLVGGYATHTLSLRGGWGMISSYVAPQSSPLDSVFGPVRGDVIIVKNGAGKTYLPSASVNTIGSWVKTEGYQLKMAGARSLGIRGLKMVPGNNPASMPAGWSIMAYLRDTEMPISTALSGMVSDVIIVKDQDGKTYMPSVGINSIGNMKVGQGYQIKLSNARTITYPNRMEQIIAPAKVVTGEKTVASLIAPPWMVTNTGASHTVVLPQSAAIDMDGTPLTAGDCVGVFYDSSGTLVCAGYEMWTGTTSIAVTSFGDDPTTPAKDGLASGELFKWKMWRHGDGMVCAAKATYLSVGGLGGIVSDTSAYTTNGISGISALKGSTTGVAEGQVPTQFVLDQNYPNPFNPSTTIRYGLPQQSEVSIMVFSMLGQEVAVLVRGEQPAGYHEVRFDASTIPSGMYLYRIQAGAFVATRKLMLIK